MNQSTITMKLPKQTAKNSRVVALFVALLIGILVKFPSTATAQTSADLAISIFNTPLDVYTNDYMPYIMYVTNLGPGTVSSVVVSNTLPSGFSLISASPTYTLSGNTLIFNLGSLTNLAVQKLLVTAEAASAGSYTFSASITSTNNTDPNTNNNSASFSVNVGNYLSGNLTASIISTQMFDAGDAVRGTMDATVEQWFDPRLLLRASLCLVLLINCGMPQAQTTVFHL